MNRPSSMNKITPLGEVCSFLVAGMAALALWSWFAGVGELLTISVRQIPMAPATALILGWLGVAVHLHTRWPAQKPVIGFGYAAAGVAAAAGLLAWLRFRFGWHSPIELWLAQTTDEIDGVPIGQMSPLTGGAFLMASLALLFRLRARGRRTGAHWIARAFAVGVAALGMSVVTGYVVGRPRAFGDYAIPMALWTAIAFILLGLALMTSPAVANASASALARRLGGMPWVLAVSTALAVGLIGALYLKSEKVELRAAAGDKLETISELKVGQIVRWRAQRKSDASFFANASFATRNVEAFFSRTVSEAGQAELLRWLRLLKAGDRYSLTALFDTNAVLRLAVPRQPGRLPVLPQELLSSAFHTNHAVMSELHRGPQPSDIHLDVVVPLLAPKPGTAWKEAEAESQSNAHNGKGYQPVGILLMQLDPQRFLYPLIQAWPVPSRTGETLLFRRDGEEILILNELRHRTNTALALRLPINNSSDLPAAKAVRGQTGRIEGRDYRGVPVLAFARAVPDSAWFIISKVDRAEIYAPLRPQASLILAMTLVLATAAGLLARLLWVRQVRTSERQRLALAERVEHLMKNANDAIMLTDEQNRIIEANDRVLELYGYSLAELQTLPPVELRAPECRPSFSGQERDLLAKGRAVFETLHRRKDGSVFPVEVSARVVEIGGVGYKLGILRDITQRKTQEREIARLSRLYAMLSQVNQSIVRVRSREELFREVCRVTVEFGGFKLVWIGWWDRETHQVKPVGCAGSGKGYLENIAVYADDRPEGRGPIGKCIRNQKAGIVNDFQTDPDSTPWQAQARAHELRAVAALPIRFQGEVCGAFTVYADEPNVFQDKEIALLEETALDISYALDHLHEEAERRRMEAALRENEASLLEAQRLARLGSWEDSSDGNPYWSPELYRIYGRDPELGPATFQAVSECFTPESCARLGEAKAQSLATGQPYECDGELMLPDGTRRWVTSRGEAIRDAAGQVVGLRGTTQDITERKQAEEALRTSEAKLHAVVQNIPQRLFIKDRNSRYVFVNENYARDLGIRAADAIGREDYEFFPRELADQYRADDRQVMESGQPKDYEEKYFHKGREIWIRTMKVPVWDENQSVTGVCGIFHDITDRKRAEAALRASDDFRLAILNSVFAEIAVLDRHGVITAVNAAWQRFASENPLADGRPPRACTVGANYLEICRQSTGLSSEGAMAAHDGILAVIEGRLPSFTLEYPCHSANTQRWFSMSVTPLGAEGLGVVVSHSNITERKRAEAELKESEQRFRSLVESAPEAIFVRTGENFAYVNAAAVRLFDAASSEQLIGQPVLERFHPEIRQATRDRMRRMDELGEMTTSVDRTMLKLDGSPVQVSLSAVSMAYQGRPSSLVFAQDITERQRAEQALRESEARHRALFENAHDAILVLTGTPFKFVSANPAALRVFGVADAATLCRLGPVDVSPEYQPDGRTSAEVSDVMIQTALRQGTHSFEWMHQRPSGEPFPALVSLSRVVLGGEVMVLATVRDITERKRMEQALHQRLELQNQLAQVAATVPGMIYSFRLRPDGSMSMPYVSAAIDMVLGLQPEDVRDDATKILALVHPDDVGPLRESILASARTMTPWHQEFRGLNTRRGDIWVEGQSVPHLEADGSVLWHGYLQDISIRKHAEEALRESDERLKLALAASEMGVWEWDLRTNAIFWSPESYAIVGVEQTDAPLLLETFTNLVHPDDRERVISAAHQAVANKTAFVAEFRLVRPDGRIVWLSDEARCSYDHEGKPLRLLGIVQDITARKQAEEEVRKLSRAVEQSPASVVITDPAGNIEYVNPKYTEVTGYTPEEVRGKNPRMLKSGETSLATYAQLWQTITRGGVWRGEFHNRKKNGELFWEFASISPVMDETGRITHFLAVKEDITERKRLEEGLRQAQKMEAVGQLAGGVAHDFNNILAATMMQLGLMKENPGLDAETRESLDELEAQANRAASLTRQLLLFSRRSVMQVRTLDLNEVVENLLKMLRRLIGENIKLEWHSASQLPPVAGDAAMLEQVVLNLVVNARDAMPNGGQLNLTTEARLMTSEQAADNPDARPGPFVCLSVTDTGCGMDAATLKRIFEPFFTTKAAGQGTGLGLATIYGIVSQHQGWITVDSKVNQGATFRVFLPASSRPQAESVRQSKPEPVRGGNETVLLVEDDAAVRSTLSAFLQRWGYQVLAAANGVAALKLWEEHQDRIRLLLTDMVMPEGMTGLELAQRLRASHPELSVIISSGYSADLLQQSNLAAERILYVPKPCPAAELAAVVRRSLGKA